MRVARCGEVMAAVVVACALATPARAQNPGPAPRVPAAEIGMEPAALVRTSRGSSSSTALAVPGAGGIGQFTGVYASLFVTREFALEPSLAYLHVSSEISSAWIGVGTLRAAVYAPGAHVSSAFAFLETGFSGGSDGYGSTNDLGAGAGYRWLVAERHVALRLEGFYRRWNGSPVETEVGVALRAGFVLPRAR